MAKFEIFFNNGSGSFGSRTVEADQMIYDGKAIILSKITDDGIAFDPETRNEAVISIENVYAVIREADDGEA